MKGKINKLVSALLLLKQANLDVKTKYYVISQEVEYVAIVNQPYLTVNSLHIVLDSSDNSIGFGITTTDTDYEILTYGGFVEVIDYLTS